MTSFATDIVDVYVFRRLNARVQFLLLQRRSDVPMAQTWQAFHHEIGEGQRAPEAARQALKDLANLTIDRFYSADFVNQFYDEARDVVVLAPVLAVTVTDQTTVDLADDFRDAGWFDRDEATARLPFSGQRWAVRHIDEIMGIGETESELYRFHPEQLTAEETSAEPEPEPVIDVDDDAPILNGSTGGTTSGLEPMAESDPPPVTDVDVGAPEDTPPEPRRSNPD